MKQPKKSSAAAISLLIAIVVLSLTIRTYASDCLSFNPHNLSILTVKKNGQTSYTVCDGPHHAITNYPSFSEASAAMKYMKKFNTICFQGRGTSNVSWTFENR